MTPTVTIIIDENCLLDDQKAALVVETIADYTRAYLLMKEAMRQKDIVSLHIRNRTVATWLATGAQGYKSFITLYTYTLRDELARRWQLSIPFAVSDRDILQSGLLDAHVTPREGQDFWNTLLEYFYGEEFAYTVFPLGNLATLLNNFRGTRWQKAAQRPLVVQAQHSRLTQWERNANSEAVRAVVRRLEQDPDALRSDLMYYKLLQNYPYALGRKVLGETWETFRAVHLDLDGLEFTLEEAGMVINEIEYYLTAQQEQVVSAEQLHELLSQMSGYLYTEFNYIESLIREHPEYLSEALLDEIGQRFRPIRSTIEHAFTKLCRSLQPLLPQEPDESWSIVEWLKWITNSYMPYYNWLDALAQRDATVARYAFIFADWLYENFVRLKNGASQYFAFDALYQERELMLVQGTITLITIVDNLNYSYFDELKRQFLQQHFVLEEVRPLLSLVPTATEVGKAALIAGTGDQIDFANTDYASLVGKVWGATLPGRKMKYLQNIGELQQERSLTHDVYFLNYLPIDEALHEDSRDTGRLHTDVAHEYLASLAKELASFARRFQIEHRLLVYVISDHGSTRIPQDVVNIIDQKFFKKLAIKNHHRFLPVDDEVFATLPQVVGTQCYLIDRRKFKTNHNYLIARQYYRFMQTQANFYVHGGLTPEEVVVPFARFTCRSITPKPPSLHLITKEYRYAVKSTIELELGNPNEFPLDALGIRLVDADANEMLITALTAKQTRHVKLTTVFRKTPGSAKTRSLTLRVRYEYQGHQFTLSDQTFEITMKSLMEVDDDDIDF